MKNPLFKNLIQVGIVVEDLKESMQKYVFDYGIGPMYVIEFNSSNVTNMSLYGKKKNYRMNLGVSPIGDVRFELVEPITDSIYTDYLQKYGQGIIHHLKLAVSDYKKALDYLQSRGNKIIQVGHQVGGRGKNMYNYLDTTDTLGFIIEVVNVEDNFVKPAPDKWFPQDKSIMPAPVFKRPNSVGIVVEDLKDKISQYRDLFGLGPWIIKEFSSKNVSDMHIGKKKKDYATKVGFYTLGNVVLKLIQPLGESIFSRFYDKYGQGVVNHLGMEVKDYDKTLNLLKSKGISVAQSGCYDDKIRYSYLSTDNDLNFIVEVVSYMEKDLDIVCP